METFRPPQDEGLCLVRMLSLPLQLRFSFDMGFLCGGLMGAAPEGPSDDLGGIDAALGRSHGHAPDLLDRPADQAAVR